jgi:hypothetical protein
VLPGHMRTSAQIIGELLTGHPEAVSLQAEAGHCRALARCSAAHASEAFDATQTARLGPEELRHRIGPRRARTVGRVAGLLILTLVGAGLTLLDAIGGLSHETVALAVDVLKAANRMPPSTGG